MKKAFLILLIGLCVVGVVVYMRSDMSEPVQKSTIVVLNGSSASGKSTTQQELLKILDGLWLRVGEEQFFSQIVPPMGESESQAHEAGLMKSVSTVIDGKLLWGVEHTKDEHGPLVFLRVGPLGLQVVHGMHRAFKAYADTGSNLVIDYIVHFPEWLPDLVKVFKNHRVYFVGVRIPLAVLEEREKARGTSPIGHARSSYDRIHAHEVYDVEVDTSKMSPEECAQTIKKYMDTHSEPQAFKILEKRFGV